jgi:16S rRNA (cytosine967-C5)-methyltransferase
MCAAPGGKTTYIGELMGNKGEILAIDKYESKLKLIKTNCDRLGITNVQSVVADATTLEIELADKVLLDAPCSGLGVLRKKPDIKWKREPEDIPRLARQQQQLLNRAATFVKTGGVIVYSTCTTEPEENSLVIKEFLSTHPEFRVDTAEPFVNKTAVTEEGFVETFPHRHHVDGSFAARLIKTT